jgi:hypothetical protein
MLAVPGRAAASVNGHGSSQVHSAARPAMTCRSTTSADRPHHGHVADGGEPVVERREGGKVAAILDRKNGPAHAS